MRSLLAAIQVLYDKNIIDLNSKDKSFQNIRNFFFIFNATKQTSNRLDKIVSETAYNVYHSKTDIEFKYMISEFFLSISKFIDENNFYQLFYSNETLMYSNKHRRLKKNSKIVKYTLISYLSHYQSDTNLNPSELTIEHLISDDGLSDNATLGNLTLTTESINSNDLGNKSITEKIDLLKNKSSIIANQTLSVYLNGNKFDSKRRFDDILKTLYNEVFNFNGRLYNEVVHP